MSQDSQSRVEAVKTCHSIAGSNTTHMIIVVLG